MHSQELAICLTESAFLDAMLQSDQLPHETSDFAVVDKSHLVNSSAMYVFSSNRFYALETFYSVLCFYMKAKLLSSFEVSLQIVEALKVKPASDIFSVSLLSCS